MKKLLLPILAVMLSVLGLSAQTTLTMDGNFTGNANLDGQSVTIDGFSLTFAKNGGSNNPTYNANGKDIRVYAKGSVTLKSGKPMTQIVFNISTQGLKRLAAITASEGTVATQASGDNTVTWTGSATEVTFTVGATADYGSEGATKAGQLDFTSIAITGGGGEVTPPTPPTPVEPTYVENIAAFLKLADANTEVTFKNPVTAVYQNGASLFVKDASGWMLIYGNVGNTYSNGDVIPAGFKGKYKDYNNLPELDSPSGLEAGTAGTPVEPEVVIVDDLSAEPLNSYLEVRGATISDVSGKNGKISDESGSLAVYGSMMTLVEGTNLTVRGFISTYKENAQFLPVEIITSSGREIVVTPVISPAGGEVFEGTLVEITCATEGATIYYTTDGSNPTADSDVYTAAIAITADMTVKALAVKDGMDDSSIAEATFTIKVQSKNETTFEFNAPATLTPAFTEGTEDDGTNKYINTNDIVFTSKGVSLVAKGGMNGEKEGTPGRLYFQSGGAVQLRIYNYGSLTITAPKDNKITKIEFGFNNTNGTNLNGGDNQVTLDAADKKIGTFTPAAAVEEVSFALKGTVQINTVTVVCENELSGVEEITLGNEDENAPAEYYNLSGIRVQNPSAGLYIVRQGSKVSKVIIR